MSPWLVVVLLVGSVRATRRDTYLTAYMESHGPSSLPPGEVYAAPADSQSGIYGAPATGYTYGVPAAGYKYGPPADEPHATPENPLDPVHAKIVLLFKVLLKLLIFKLIVKFIAIICVFFFLPKLSGLGLAKEDASRRTGKDKANELQLTQFILNSISGSTGICRTEDGPLCKLRRAVEEADKQNSISRLFGIYLKEEEEKIRHRAASRKR